MKAGLPSVSLVFGLWSCVHGHKKALGFSEMVGFGSCFQHMVANRFFSWVNGDMETANCFSSMAGCVFVWGAGSHLDKWVYYWLTLKQILQSACCEVICLLYEWWEENGFNGLIIMQLMFYVALCPSRFVVCCMGLNFSSVLSLFFQLLLWLDLSLSPVIPVFPAFDCLPYFFVVTVNNRT